MTKSEKKLWWLRVAVPAVGFVIALCCGKSPSGAIGTLLWSALFMVIASVFPFSVVGLVFIPVIALYGIKLDRSTPAIDLDEPDAVLFLMLSVPATWATIGLLAIYIG